jgi:RNA polymerase sigma-70 factor (ECF subfamily)
VFAVDRVGRKIVQSSIGWRVVPVQGDGLRRTGAQHGEQARADSGGGSGAESDHAAGGTPGEVTVLLHEAAGGSDEAWRALVGLYAARIYALARSRCGDGDLAEEITQSVFATVSEKIGRSGIDGAYSERGRFEAWLFRIAMNRVRDEARRKTRRRRLDAGLRDEARVTTNDPSRDSEATDTGPGLAALRRAMDGLNDADRDVIELRHHSQMSFQQIADLRGEPVGTLLARHHRALRKLRAMMEAAEAAESSEAADAKEQGAA